MGRDSVVGVATVYGLDGPRLEYWWERDFPHSSRLSLGPTQPPVQWVPDLFPGGTAAGSHEYQEHLLGVKGGRCVGLTTLPLPCANCLEIWEPQPSGTPGTCPS